MPSQNFQQQHQASSSNSSLEDMMREFIQKQDKRNEDQNRINAQTSQELVDIRTTLSQLAVSLSHEKGKFPAQPQKNPRGVNEVFEVQKEDCNAVITLRNGKEYEGPKLPVSEEDIPARDEPTVEKNVRNEKASEKYEEVIVSKNKMSVSNHLPFPSAMQRHKVGDKTLEILEVLKQVKINIPLLDMIKQVPAYAKFLKDLCTVKRRIKLSKKAFLTEQVSAIIENKAMVKYKDPGCPTISVQIGDSFVERALLDLGASVNLLPYSIYKQLGLGELKATTITLSLADHSIKVPRGVVEDVLVQVEKVLLPSGLCGVRYRTIEKGVENDEESKKEEVEISKPELKPLPHGLKFERDKSLDLHASYLFGRECKTSKAATKKAKSLMQDVVRNEVLKLLDAGIIYPISDSSWVSPTQVVPKKSGITVMKNDEGELIPTRLTTGWRVCIDFRKLNAVTKKDHFPLPFLDQVLERVAGHDYHCFLDGYSGYFQIAIALEDQEKTTFTCPLAPMLIGACFWSLCIENDLVLNWEKCHFMATSGVVLGHIISKEGIQVDPAKIELISKLPSPTTVKEDAEFIWTKACQEAFKRLKSLLTTAPIVRSPNWSLPFELMCDASDYAVGAVLGQREDGKPYVVYYASKTLNDAQKNYTTTEKELLAVDAKARLIRWILLLQEFNIQIKDKQGVENVVADHLSRVKVESHFEEAQINDEFPDDALCAVEKLPWFANIVNYLATGELPSEWNMETKKYFLSRAKHYAWDDPYLYKFCPDQIMRRCVPEDEQQDILRMCMKELVEVILLQGRLQQKFYRVDSIGQLCSRIVTLIAKVVHNVNNWGKSTQVDYVSKWVEAVGCKSNDHKVKYGVRHKVSTPYHPQTNGQAELANREIKRILTKNSNIVHIGPVKKMNFDSDQAGAKRKYDLNELEAYRNESYECLCNAREKHKFYHDKLILRREFKQGEKVLLYDSKLHIFPGKLRSRWNGPYVVKEVFLMAP
ncbi:Retrovirus-related Pol polyprotein from transposon 17.6 [Vitis vinifera]|uniref:Retrovirus-related Pol polyprotein from transposon 17.6 n=1 Tax=Vitis vinifera TaxID=29760 RepID=A0A438DBL8_VITVI|nr:Retrovirus-related Pol polyprotein from transposon 17.6 [Vitis vinifera]